MNEDPAREGPDSSISPASWDEVVRRSRAAAIRLAARTIVLRVVAFGGAIALARIVDPADLGAYAVFSSLVAFFALAGDIGITAGIVQRPTEPEAADLETAWTIQLAIALGGVLLIWLVAPALPVLVPSLPGDSATMLRVLAVGLLISALRALPTALLERRLEFGAIALAEVAQQAVFYVVAIPLALGGQHAWSYVWAGLAQLAAATLIVKIAVPSIPRIAIHRDAARSLLGFGIHFQLSQVAIWLRDAPVPFVTALMLGSSAAGVLQLAYRLAFTVSSVDELISRIAYPAFSRLAHDAALTRRALDRIVAFTALVVTPAQCGVAALAPALVPWLLGDEWAGIVAPLELLSIGTLLWFPIRYIRQAVFATGDGRRALTIAVAATALDLVPLVPLLLLLGAPGAGLAFLGGSAAGLAAAVVVARHRVEVDLRPWARLLVAGLIAAGAGRLALETTPAAIHLALGAAVFAAAFASLTWLLEPATVRQAARPLLRRAVTDG